jgi:hypothetical protein
MKGVDTMIILKMIALMFGAVISLIAFFSAILAEEKTEKLDAFLKSIVAITLLLFGNTLPL